MTYFFALAQLLISQNLHGSNTPAIIAVINISPLENIVVKVLTGRTQEQRPNKSRPGGEQVVGSHFVLLTAKKTSQESTEQLPSTVETLCGKV